MSRARVLADRANQNTLAVDTTNSEVGIASTVPNATLDVRGEVKVGTAVQLGVAGVVTATSFSGSGSNLTGLATTETIRADTLTVAGVSTLTGVTNVTGVVNFASAVNVDATTDSTSSTSGALIVDGGVGIAKNVYIGAGLSVAGTLTYEDVTNVDSVGLITAKSGVNVTGGQLTVGVAYSVGAAGVCTAAGFVGPLTGTVTGTGANLSDIPLTSLDLNGGIDIGAGLADADLFIVDDAAIGSNRKTAASRIKTYVSDLTLTTAAQTNITSLGTLSALTISGNLTLDNGADAGKDLVWNTASDGLEFKDSVYAFFGDSNDLRIYHSGSHSLIEQTGTGNLYIRPKTGEDGITLVADGAVTLAYDNGTKFATTNDGTVTTGIGTFSNGVHVPDNAGIAIGSRVSGTTLGDLRLYHDGSNSYMDEIGTGNLYIRNNTDNAIFCETNAGVKIYYDNSEKIKTTNDGVVITGICTDSKGDVRSVPRNSKSSAYVLIASDHGKCITITSGGVTINPSVMKSGDIVTIINDSGSNQTITQGSSMTLYDTGDDGSTGNKTLKGRGMCTVWFTSDNNAYITGNFD